jgi:hypothetical protein
MTRRKTHKHDYKAVRRINRIVLFECAVAGCRLSKTKMIPNFTAEKAREIDERLTDPANR